MTGPTQHDARGQAGEVGKADNTDDTPQPTQIAQAWQFPSDPTVLYARVGADLASGHVLTTNTMLTRYGHSRGSDSVHKLRKLGWPIQTERIEVPTSDGGRLARIGRYWIMAADIAAAGDQLREFVAEVRRARGGA